LGWEGGGAGGLARDDDLAVEAEPRVYACTDRLRPFQPSGRRILYRRPSLLPTSIPLLFLFPSSRPSVPSPPENLAPPLRSTLRPSPHTASPPGRAPNAHISSSLIPSPNMSKWVSQQPFHPSRSPSADHPRRTARRSPRPPPPPPRTLRISSPPAPPPTTTPPPCPRSSTPSADTTLRPAAGPLRAAWTARAATRLRAPAGTSRARRRRVTTSRGRRSRAGTTGSSRLQAACTTARSRRCSSSSRMACTAPRGPGRGPRWGCARGCAPGAVCWTCVCSADLLL
jgi:hypothetical protein